MDMIQRRLASPPSLRAGGVSSAPGRQLVGYAAKFGVESGVMYDPGIYCDRAGRALPFVEVLDPGCFARTLRDMPDVRALYNHNTDAVLGRTASGTLRLSVDRDGLHFVDDLPDTIDGQRARELVGRGDIDGCSFGFSIVRNQLVERSGRPALHTILDVNLYEISIAVAFPAYPQTEVSLNYKAVGRASAEPPSIALARRRLALAGL